MGNAQLAGNAVQAANIAAAAVGTAQLAPNLTLGGTTTGAFNAFGGLIIENRTTDPPFPAVGQIWLRTDL